MPNASGQIIMRKVKFYCAKNSGEVMVLAENGKTEFVGFWQCLIMMWKMIRAGRKKDIEIIE